MPKPTQSNQPFVLPEQGQGVIKLPQFASALGIGIATVYRRAKHEPNFPKIIRFGARCSRVDLDDARRYLAEVRAAAETTS